MAEVERDIPVPDPSTLGELIEYEISLVRMAEEELKFIKQVSPKVFQGRKRYKAMRERADKRRVAVFTAAVTEG